MRYFRSKWLRRIFFFLLLVLLNAGPFDFIEQQTEGKDEFVIHAPQYLAKLSSLQKHEIKYGFDAINVSAVPIFKKIISADYIPGTSFDPLSIDLLTCLSRAPPRFVTIQ